VCLSATSFLLNRIYRILWFHSVYCDYPSYFTAWCCASNDEHISYKKLHSPLPALSIAFQGNTEFTRYNGLYSFYDQNSTFNFRVDFVGITSQNISLDKNPELYIYMNVVLINSVCSYPSIGMTVISCGERDGS